MKVVSCVRGGVIDDDAYSRKLCELILTRWGMTVHLANDGIEAMAQVRGHRFDVVLTDIQLPGVSGKTVARNIRKHDKDVPILALTANILSNEEDFFKNSAISGHLLKPFTEQELHQKLAEALPGTLVVAEAVEMPLLPAEEVQPVLLPSPDPATGRLYDLSEMRMFTGTDEETLAAVLEVLLADQQQNLQQLSAAAAAANWNKAANVAHKMLTAFKHLKAHSVTPDLLELEQVLHTGKAGQKDLKGVVARVNRNTQQVLVALQEEMESLRAVPQA